MNRAGLQVRRYQLDPAVSNGISQENGKGINTEGHLVNTQAKDLEQRALLFHPQSIYKHATTGFCCCRMLQEATKINGLKHGLAKILKRKPINLCFKQYS